MLLEGTIAALPFIEPPADCQPTTVHTVIVNITMPADQAEALVVQGRVGDTVCLQLTRCGCPPPFGLGEW